MDNYEEIYDKYLKTAKVEDENIFKLMQGFQKKHECEFSLKYTTNLPIINEGYTVKITDKTGSVYVEVSTSTLKATVMIALAKFRTMIIEDTTRG